MSLPFEQKQQWFKIKQVLRIIL